MELQAALERDAPTSERVDAAALRLQNLYTGIKRCLVLIVGALNGGNPVGADWHRRRLSTTADGLGELLRFHHVVRHLYAFDLQPDGAQHLLGQAINLWPGVTRDFDAFSEWVRQLLRIV